MLAQRDVPNFIFFIKDIHILTQKELQAMDCGFF